MLFFCIAQDFCKLKQGWKIPKKFGREAVKHFITFTSLSYVFQGKLLIVRFLLWVEIYSLLQHHRKVAKRQGLAGDSKVRISIVCPVSPNFNSNYPLLSEYENMLVLWERLRSESALSETGRLVCYIQLSHWLQKAGCQMFALLAHSVTYSPQKEQLHTCFGSVTN